MKNFGSLHMLIIFIDGNNVKGRGSNRKIMK